MEIELMKEMEMNWKGNKTKEIIKKKNKGFECLGRGPLMAGGLKQGNEN